MDLTTIVRRYDEELRTADYADLDASANGLQVGPDEGDIDHVAFAVDAAVATIEAAADAGADLLVTHHGLSWGGFERVTDSHYRRIAPLVENDLALYVSHLPLDGHMDLGNAAGLADHLGLGAREPFGSMGPETIGQRGRAPDGYTADELKSSLDRLDGKEHETQVLDFGPETLEDIAIVTGSGTDWIDEAAAADVDALVTGEGKQKAYHEAREAGLSVFLAGHYATETFGVRALQERAKAWGLTTTYIQHATGL